MADTLMSTGLLSAEESERYITLVEDCSKAWIAGKGEHECRLAGQLLGDALKLYYEKLENNSTHMSCITRAVHALAGVARNALP